jgi:hypothetical protein
MFVTIVTSPPVEASIRFGESTERFAPFDGDDVALRFE